MISHALNYSSSTRVADTETLACNAVYEKLAARSAVKRNVSDYDIFICLERRVLRRINYDSTAAEALAYIVVAVTAQFECKSLRNECAKALAARALTLYMVRIVFKRIAVQFSYL